MYHLLGSITIRRWTVLIIQGSQWQPEGEKQRDVWGAVTHASRVDKQEFTVAVSNVPMLKLCV